MNKIYCAVHLHTTTGSVGDSIIRYIDLKMLKDYGYQAVAVSDHGSLASIHQFQNECISYGLKPILGCEFYVSEVGDSIKDIQDFIIQKKLDKQLEIADDKYNAKNIRSHICLYARNRKGLKNIVKINNEAVTNRFYRKPLASWEYIFQNSNDILVTTACIGSKLNMLRREEKEEEAIQWALKLQEIFGENLFLEIQINKGEQQNYYNKFLNKISKQLNIPLIYGIDAHYVLEQDYIVQRVYKNILQKKVSDFDIAKIEHEWDNSIPANIEVVLNKWKEMDDGNFLPRESLERAIDNTQQFANKVTDDPLIVFDGYKLKSLTSEEQKEVETFLESKIQTLNIDNKNKYISRLKKEKETFNSISGVWGYLYILWKAISETKNKTNLLTNFGRGSASGSLISYLLGITNIDPIKNNLSFERFLSYNKSEPFEMVFPDVSEL